MTPLNRTTESVTKRLNLASFLLALLVFNMSLVNAQKTAENHFWIENSLPVNGSLDMAWKVLADFTGVGEFHALYDETNLLKGASNEVAVGTERESLIPDGMFNLIQKERVVDLSEGSYLTYEIYESDKPSMESMLVTYGVRADTEGNVMIYNQISFKEGSRVWKNFSKRKQSRESQMSLISFKHRIETGESEKNIKRLKEWFALSENKRSDTDLLATTDLKVN